LFGGGDDDTVKRGKCPCGTATDIDGELTLLASALRKIATPFHYTAVLAPAMIPLSAD